MPNKSKWTVIFDDKKILNQSVTNSDGWATAYEIDDDAFWNDPKWQDINAIQYIDDDNDHNDCVEMVPGTFGRNKTYAESGLGDFREQFITKWDAAHLARLQEDWDNDPRDESEKGARPTSYVSP
tara:strand:- start:2698 stop:3072 length:375 start_codon:yes stop_codon:yes gene_type:complete